MYRLLMVALAALPLIFWDSLEAGVRDARGWTLPWGVGDLRAHMAAMTSNWISELGLDDNALTALSFGSFLYAFVMGFFFDSLLGSRAFGPKLSGALSLVGAATAVVAWISFAPHSLASVSSMMIVGGLGSALAVASYAVLRASAIALLDRVASGARRTVKRNAAELRFHSAVNRRPTGGQGY